VRLAAFVWVLAAHAVLASAAEPFWLKQYSIPPYSEIRTAELKTKTLDDAPKIVAAIEIAGGILTAPVDAFVSAPDQRQLSFTIDKAKARDLAKGLKRFGRLDAPAGRPHGAIPAGEIKEKLARLRAERKERGEALAGAPIAAEAAAELVARYSALESQARAAESRSLWNLTIRVKK